MQASRTRSLRRRIAGALALLAAGTTLAASAGSAQAIIARTPGGAVSYQPLRPAQKPGAFDQLFSNLDYNGGPVMPSNTNYTVYWAPQGALAYPPDYEPGIDGYFADLARDSGGRANVDSVATQYNDAAGHLAAYDSHFAGALIDTDPYPANGCGQASICLTDHQIRSELTAYVSAHGLPADLTHEYFLLTPPGVESCLEAAGRQCSAGSLRPFFCAYHGSTAAGQRELLYTNDPYVSGNPLCDDGNHPNGTSADGALQGGLSHEHVESVTDPEPDSAWIDLGGSGGEIGDKCNASLEPLLGFAANGAAYNQVVGGHLYWYQEEWSNQGSQCLQRFTFSGARPAASFGASKEAGDAVAFDASASTAPGGVVRYSWQFNDEAGVRDHAETSTPFISHTFPEAGIYEVALTVFAPDGTSAGAAHGVAAGAVPPPLVTKVSPRKGSPGGGTSVTITGSAFTGATAVDFGAVPASSFTVRSPTSIVATSPAEPAGTVDVSVTTPAGTSLATLADLFKFGPPKVTEVAPDEGPAGGGTHVKVTGIGFAPGATVIRFAHASAQGVECASTTTCTAISPPHKPETVEVRVSAGGFTSPRDPSLDQFSYR